MENFNKEKMDKLANVNRQFNFTKRSNEKIRIDKNMRQKISTAPSRKRIRKMLTRMRRIMLSAFRELYLGLNLYIV